MWTVTPCSARSIPVTVEPTRNDIPCLPNDRASAAETSASSLGSARSDASTTVTFAPYAAYTYANSTPIEPAPMITAWVGAVCCTIAWRYVITVSPSTWIDGRRRGRAPVATMIDSASTCSSPTDSACEETNDARPLMYSTPCLSNSAATPLVSRFTILRLRSSATA